MERKIKLKVNGRLTEVLIDVRESLLDVLRYKLHLTGTKKGCEAGECGACTVLVNGEAIDSCIYLAIWADGKIIETIEGQGKDGNLSPIQKAFIEENAIQCGFCTPGFVMSAKALLIENTYPTKDEIKKGLSGNMCRCTGYQNIIKAVVKLSKAK